ncbi:hypothetical protein Trydic_g13527 [Trypoxylus dichotomus]
MGVVIEQCTVAPQQKDVAKVEKIRTDRHQNRTPKNDNAIDEKIDIESLLPTPHHHHHYHHHLHSETLKNDVDFLQSLVSISTFKEAARRPITSGIVILTYILFSVMLLVGMISLKTCSTHGIVSIYLIIAGITGIGIKMLTGTINKYLFNTLIVLVVLYVIWHIICSYFIFKAYHPNYDPEEGPYCSRVAYLVAFWSLVVQYMLFGVVVLLCVFRVMMRGDTKT